MEFVKNRGLSIPVTDGIADRAADFSKESKLSTVDAVIYATAVANHATLLTMDNDFRGLKGAVVLD